MPFFTFIQNNSGGFFADPARFVIIEASNYNYANALATSYGIYFDGVDTDDDCQCCGDRWHRVSEYDADDTPLIYGTPPSEYAPYYGDDADVLIVYADGGTETVVCPPARGY